MTIKGEPKLAANQTFLEVQIDWTEDREHLHLVVEVSKCRMAQDLTPREARKLAEELVKAANKLDPVTGVKDEFDHITSEMRRAACTAFRMAQATHHSLDESLVAAYDVMRARRPRKQRKEEARDEGD